MANKMLRLDWRGWLYGLMHGTIGGAAQSGLSWTGMTVAKSVGYDVPTLNWKALGILMVSGAVPSFLLYLKQSPLPSVISEQTTTVTLKQTVETQPTDVTPNS